MESCPYCGREDFRDGFLRKRHLMGCSSNPQVVAKREELQRQAAREAEEEAARKEAVREVLEGGRPLLLLRSVRVPRSMVRPIELRIRCASVRPEDSGWGPGGASWHDPPEFVEGVVLDGTEVPCEQVGGSGWEGRYLELSGQAMEAAMRQLGSVHDAGMADLWEVRWVLYQTHREIQSLVLTVLTSLERVEYRYEYEDLS